MAGSGGPWGGGSGGGDDRGGGRKPDNEGPQIPEIDEIVRKGQERLRVLMGGGGGGQQGGGRGPSKGGPAFTRQGVFIGVLAAAGL